MRVQKLLPINNFRHKTFAVLAIFAFIAFLMTLKPVAEMVKKGLDAVGISAAVEMIQVASSYLVMIGVGLILLLFTPFIFVAVVKIAVTLVAVGLVGYGLFSIYNLFTGKKVTNPLPQGTIQNK
jgi:hypothetical protein